MLTVAVLWPLTPSVGDAEQRIAARLSAHGARDPQALPTPDRVGQAVIATEDSRFYSTFGIDPVSVARVTLATVAGSGDAGGATLEQQLAKLVLTPGQHGLASKVVQGELAVKLDATYSKDQILEMYLSSVYFGHGYYGLPAAARGFFGRAPADLSWGQAALLAGLVQAPSAFDPYAHYQSARARQRHVLDRLVATGVLTPQAAQAAYTSPLALR